MFKILLGAGKWIGAFAIVGGLAWQAASFPIRFGSDVIIHVGVEDVEVWVDELRFHVDRPWEHPIVCQREPGVHELAMLKNGVEIYYETFEVAEDEDNVLTAWNEAGVLVAEDEDNVLTAWNEAGVLDREPAAPHESAERTAFQCDADGEAGLASNPLRRN